MPVREQYVTEITNIPGEKGKWGTTHVKIKDMSSPSSESEGALGKVVYEYNRNYSMMKTFEPFRQLKDGIWHDYALISSDYTRFEVVDLEQGIIIAQEPYPVITQRWLDNIPPQAKAEGGWAASYKLGDEQRGWGFCPVEFRVWNWRDSFRDEMLTKTYKSGDTEKLLYSLEDLQSHTGQWALYTGCVWGDDSSWKLRYIDLSQISEGIVTSEDKFGYFPMGSPLEQVIYDGKSDEFYLNLELSTSRVTGESFDPGVLWEKEETTDKKDSQ